jgi:hypothetical protein
VKDASSAVFYNVSAWQDTIPNIAFLYVGGRSSGTLELAFFQSRSLTLDAMVVVRNVMHEIVHY